MNDLISRQLAIEAIEDHEKACKTDMDGYNMARRHMKELIEVLPAAQPEIIYCKDCKWFDVDRHQCYRQICAVFYENDYCSYAERRTNE